VKICLVQPYDVNRWYYVTIPSLGLGYIAAAAERAGHDVRIIDCLKLRLDEYGLVKRLEDEDADIVGITFHSTDYAAVKRYADAIKRMKKRPILTLGGPHPTFEPRTTLDEMAEVDIIFTSEAEESFPAFIKEIENGADVREAARITKGVAFKDDGEYVKTQRTPLVDINKFPFPAWHLIEPESYPTAPIGIFSRRMWIAPMNATRGCRANCAYCAAGKMAGYQVRVREPENIVDEMKMLANRGIQEIHFMDDSLTHDRNFVLRFCNELKGAGFRIPWACPNGIRLDTLDAEMLREMEEAGCYAFSVGIESGSQRILDDMHKGLSVETIREKIMLIKENSDIEVTGFFIIGYPGETVDDIMRTIRFSTTLPLNRANYFNFAPFPGSRIYTKLKRIGMIGKLDYSSLYVHQIVYTPPGMTKRQLQRLQKKAYMNFYMRARILFKLAMEIKSFSQVKTIARRVYYVLFRAGRNKQQPYSY
jgi:anaerobic magnesium-protoporphyrin IX monomethyl ester cyclase